MALVRHLEAHYHNCQTWKTGVMIQMHDSCP